MQSCSTEITASDKKLLNDILYQAHPDIGMTLSVEYIRLVTEDKLETFDCLCAEDRVTQQREQLGGGGGGRFGRLGL